LKPESGGLKTGRVIQLAAAAKLKAVPEPAPDSVCVIIVNYNAGVMLTECVRSVLRSTVPVQVVVSDNGSRDNSVAFLRAALDADPALTIVENGVNLGFAKGNNIVLPLCRCEYVLFLNPDCIIQPDTLEHMIAVMDRYPEAGMAGCLVLNPDGSEQVGCRRYVPTPWRSLVRVLRLNRVIKNHPRFQSISMRGLPLPSEPTPVEALSGAFMFVRRRAMEEVGPMDASYFLHCEDLDWCMRFRRAGWKILFVPYVSIMHWKGFSSRIHPVRVEFHKHRGMVRFYRKFFRHQYPGILMYLVIIAVWIRFLLKSTWVTLNSPMRLRRIPRVRVPAAPAQQEGSPRDA
jgi:GT2 family glycosyltransferase